MHIKPIKILFELIFLLLPGFTAEAGLPCPLAAGEVEGMDKTVLIINSYHPETKWSTEISDKLCSRLTARFPGIHIHRGNLNIEENPTLGTRLLSLRGIIWQMAEQEGEAINPESLGKDSFYQTQKRPDVIVCIGEEAYYEHLSMHIWQGKWIDIPIVCCGLNDSIMNPNWYIADPLHIQHIGPAEAPTNQQFTTTFTQDSIVRKYTKIVNKTGMPFKERAIRTPDGNTRLITRYHTTGVLAEIPVRENLELLKTLMPDLQEMVWIDNQYYKNAYALYRLRQELPKIFPGTKLSVWFHDKINTDSIYNAMLEPAANRVFVTYAWNIDGVYSRLPEQQLDSLFSEKLTSPILVLSECPTHKDYWLGGVHTLADSIVSPTIEQITCLLTGTPADSIPYVKIRNTETHLNVPTLKRFGLEKQARTLSNVVYQNIPPSFYRQHETTILIVIILAIIFIGTLILVVKHLLFTKKIRAEYINYRKLYKRLQVIYQNSNLDFALYNQEGSLIFHITDNKKNHALSPTGTILSNSLFSNPYLDATEKQQLNQNLTVNKEIETERQRKPSGIKETQKWNLIVKPLSGNAAPKARYIAIVADLTLLSRERKAKERSEHIYQFASETAGIGVASYNLLTGKCFASESWLLNLNEKSGTGTLPAYENVCPEDREALLAFRQNIYKNQVTAPFIRIIQVKDDQRNLHYVKEYIFVREYAPERKIISVVELNINYDEPKQKENELQKAREKAEASNLETEQFLANISHEIRTPLNAIVGFSSILANTDMDEEEMNSVAPIIEQNNNLLLALINNILYLSKLDSGTLTFHYTPVDAHTLFHKMAKTARENLTSTQIEIKEQIPPVTETLFLAETQFNLVMENLISNAIKFTSQGEIVIGYEKREKEYYFFVKDTGCGVHLVDQENIFKRFNKLDVFTQGTGLGLALCRSIVKHQQGKIGVLSTPGKGSTFWFTLPEKINVPM